MTLLLPNDTPIVKVWGVEQTRSTAGYWAAWCEANGDELALDKWYLEAELGYGVGERVLPVFSERDGECLGFIRHSDFIEMEVLH